MVGFRGTFLEIPRIFLCRRQRCSHRADQRFRGRVGS